MRIVKREASEIVNAKFSKIQIADYNIITPEQCTKNSNFYSKFRGRIEILLDILTTQNCVVNNIPPKLSVSQIFSCCNYFFVKISGSFSGMRS